MCEEKAIEVVSGVFCGSGMDELPGLEEVRTHSMVKLGEGNPYGQPSGRIVEGKLYGRKVLSMLRHGEGHVLSPSEVPYRANVWAFKQRGVTQVLSVSAVGSLQEGIVPGHLVIPDQIIDRTKGIRPHTFFGGGIVAHASFGEPYCLDLRMGVLDAARRVAGVTTHNGGTLVCMEGPQFSTRAESCLYRSWGADIIGMTVLPEAKLVREAGMCYATLALATDYDAWREGHDAVTVDMVVEQMKENSAMAVAVLCEFFKGTSWVVRCKCRQALKDAIATNPDPRVLSPRDKTRYIDVYGRLKGIGGGYLPELKREY